MISPALSFASKRKSKEKKAKKHLNEVKDSHSYRSKQPSPQVAHFERSTRPMELVYAVEDLYLGETLGNRSLYQLSAQDHQHACLTSNRSAGDSTGLRAYSASQLIVRFLVKHNELLHGKKIVELGCGVGVVGLLGVTFCRPKLVVLTDGQTHTQSVVDQNIELVQATREANAPPWVFTSLKWGNSMEIADTLDICAEHCGHPRKFDVVLGCELMYYGTNVTDLLYTVFALTNHTGLFIHGHFFRKDGQEDELIVELAKYQWSTIEVPCIEFISPEELGQNALWLRARMLVSGPDDVIAQLRAEHPDWITFQELVVSPEPSDCADDDSGSEDGTGVGLLFG